MKTISELYQELDKIRPFVNGRGREVAERAGVAMPTYYYYMRKLGRNPEMLRKIIKAAKLELAQIQKEMEQV